MNKFATPTEHDHLEADLEAGTVFPLTDIQKLEVSFEFGDFWKGLSILVFCSEIDRR